MSCWIYYGQQIVANLRVAHIAVLLLLFASTFRELLRFLACLLDFAWLVRTALSPLS